VMNARRLIFPPSSEWPRRSPAAAVREFEKQKAAEIEK
jgi:hypothetical protein